MARVLEKIEEIFRRQTKSCEIVIALKLIQEQCTNHLHREYLIRFERSDKIAVRRCDFSKMQFPKCVVKRLNLKIPVRHVNFYLYFQINFSSQKEIHMK